MEALNQEIPETEGGAKTKQWAETHTQIRRELTTRNQLGQLGKYYVVRDYNRRAGERPRANTHTHRQHAVEPLPEALGLPSK